MSKIECSCKSDTCYSCRRQAIDATAQAIVAREMRVCEGMDFDVQAHAWRIAADWRSRAICDLAYESAGWH